MARGRRGRSKGYDFLDGMMMDIVKESPKPMPPLGISFMVNEKSKDVVNFNIVKQHLDLLVTHKKIFKGEITENNNKAKYPINIRRKDKVKTVVYWSKPIHSTFL